MRRLLVITYYFPPDGSVGGLRWAGLTKYLARSGWEVCVVSRSPDSAEEAAAGVRVESCAPARTLNDWYHALAKKRRAVPAGGRASRTADQTRPRGGRDGLLHRLRAEAAALLELPDTGRGWILRAASRVRSLVRHYRPDVIVSSGPPHSVHLVAWLATVGRSVPCYLDLRDPWAYVDPTHPVSTTRVYRATIPRLERWLCRWCDGLITTTQELTAELAASYPGVPVVTVPNGVDRDGLPSAGDDAFPRLALTTAGTLYLQRDLGSVLSAFRKFLDSHPEAVESGSKLRIAGYVERPHAVRMQHQITSLDLHRNVEVLGRLPRREALRLVARSNVAIVPAQGYRVQIPAKLYESIGMGVPTLVITETDGSTRREAQRLGATVLHPEDGDGIVRFFEGVWRGAPMNGTADPETVDYRAIADELSRMLAPSGLAAAGGGDSGEGDGSSWTR